MKSKTLELLERFLMSIADDREILMETRELARQLANAVAEEESADD